MKPTVQHGFAVVRQDGRGISGKLYPNRDAATFIASNLSTECTVRRARLVTSLKQSGGMMATARTQLIVEQER